jgi:hypothetical protein
MSNDGGMLKKQLVDIALEWQKNFGVAPQITTPLSECDAAMLVGMSEAEYSSYMQEKTVVSAGSDFIYSGIRYRIAC